VAMRVGHVRSGQTTMCMIATLLALYLALPYNAGNDLVDPVNTVEIRAKVERAVTPIGHQSYELVVWLENHTKKAVHLHPDFSIRDRRVRFLPLKVVARARDGQVLQYVGPELKVAPVSDAQLIRVGPRRSYGARLVLNEVFDLRRGLHSLEIHYDTTQMVGAPGLARRLWIGRTNHITHRVNR
jgi:hypothetical protein